VRNTDPFAKCKTKIIVEDAKSLSSIREIPIPDFIVSILYLFSENMKSDDFFITGNKKFMETRTFFNQYKMILKEISLGKYNFHALRHTFATRCIENGCDPKTLRCSSKL